MKKLSLIILLNLILFCGCEFALEHENAIIFFSQSPITKEGFDPEMTQNTFDQGQIIYFCLYSKTPFNCNEGRIQILKKDPNTQSYGYCMVQGKDILLNPAKNYYMDSFTIFSEGYYLIRIFSKTNPNKPLVQTPFWVAP